jgi:hypothetical protein
MSLNDAMSRAVRELTDLVTEEQDIEQLRELVLAINALLSVIAKQREKLEGDRPLTH